MGSSSAVESWPWLPKGFASTRWSMVRRVATPDGVQSNEAAEMFCRVYWYPLYGYLRSKGYSGADAQDHVESFLSQLVERGTLGKADPPRGG